MTADAKEQTEPDVPAVLKPLLRGRLHQAAFVAAIPAALALVLFARSTLARVAVAIYGLSLIGLFGASAAYHVGTWPAHVAALWRRIDHSMIYVLIAGTYTPFSLLVLRAPWSIVLLSLVCVGAVAGILMKLFAFDRSHVVTSALYIVLGWLIVFAGPQIVHRLHASELVPLALGGLLYTGGAIVLATHKPNPSPRWFGYHEVWHLSTIVAGICHYAAVLQVVLAAH